MTELSDKWYLDVGFETFEISEATFKELANKGIESFMLEQEYGYFWTSHILRIREAKCIS